MKILSSIVLVTLFMLTGCENPLKKSEKRPSKKELQETLFKDSMPFLTFHHFECHFENDPEKAKENKYQIYINTIFSYNEPLYIGYKLNDPQFYKENGLEVLASLASENKALKESGREGLSPVLWKVIDKWKKFRSIILVDVEKIDKQWICSSWELISGDDVKGDPVSFFASNFLIYGSREHLKELHQYGIKFPGDKI